AARGGSPERRRRGRARALRRRRLRPQPCRGGGHPALARGLRGRAADGPGGRIGRCPHPGREADGMSELEKVRALARAALASLEANRQRIDDLNVYPVPDGDTGTNLTLTVRGVVDVLDDSTAADRGVLG